MKSPNSRRNWVPFAKHWSLVRVVNHRIKPLYRCRLRHDRTATVWLQECSKKKIRNNHIRRASKGKRIFCCSTTCPLRESCRNFISKSLHFTFGYGTIFKVNNVDSMFLGSTNNWITFDCGATSESKSCFCRATVEPNCTAEIALQNRTAEEELHLIAPQRRDVWTTYS